MRERKKVLPARPVQLRLWTLTDKRSKFRTSEPDRHIVELALVKEGGAMTIVREWPFDDPKRAEEHYEHLLQML